MTLASGNFGPNPSPRPEKQPRLRLLVELEPAYRVFLRNLSDVLRSRVSRESPRFRSHLSGGGLFRLRPALAAALRKSLVGQLVVLAMVLLVSQLWITHEQPRAAQPVRKYPPHLLQARRLVSGVTQQPGPGVRRCPRSRPSPRVAARLTRARTRPGSRQSARHQAEGAGATQHGGFERGASGDAACGYRPLRDCPGPQARLRSLPRRPRSARGLRGGSVCRKLPVSPRPQSLGSFPQGVLVTVPGAAVVAPPPVLQASISRVGDINIGPAAVVAPAPRLPVGEQRTISGALQSGLGAWWHWPCRLRLWLRFRTLPAGRAGSLSGVGSGVVPPPPSVQALGRWWTLGSWIVRQSFRALSLSGPFGAPPSAERAGAPPPPSLCGAGGSDAAQRAGLFSGRLVLVTACKVSRPLPQLGLGEAEAIPPWRTPDGDGQRSRFGSGAAADH